MLKQLGAILEAGGATYSDVVRTTVSCHAAQYVSPLPVTIRVCLEGMPHSACGWHQVLLTDMSNFQKV